MSVIRSAPAAFLASSEKRARSPLQSARTLVADRLLGKQALFISVLLLTLNVQSGQAADALQFFKNYFLTGDYAVAGVGVAGTGSNGFATGVIDMSGASIPDTADILGAFLYWETIETTQNPGSGAMGAKFGYTDPGLVPNDISSIAKPLGAGTPPCWSSGGGTGSSGGAKNAVVYRADVLRFITKLNAAGKRLVKTTFTVVLADSGSTGNLVPITQGASLVVVYRDPSLPLKAVVIYDGAYTMDQSTGMMSQNIQGFYQAGLNSGLVGNPQARITHIVGSGQLNKSENLGFNGQLLAVNPFKGVSASGTPDWDNLTFDTDHGLNMTGVVGLVNTTVDHVGFSTFDCLSWGAIVFSTTVQDTDGDGLLDLWETNGLYENITRDASGNVTASSFGPCTGLAGLGTEQAFCVNLPAMGANKDVKDIFVEIGYTQSNGYSYPSGSPYGSLVPAHSHLPSPASLNMVATAFRNAPVDNLNGFRSGVNIHFDVGSNDQFQPANCAWDSLTWTSACAIIPSAYARGGEAINESCATDPAPCVPDSALFPHYPGTVGWKTGFRFLRDQPLPPYATESACIAAGAGCQRRFDHDRRNIFHYALFAHALGIARGAAGADLVTPKSTSGISDLPGGDILVTLGFWDSNDFLPAVTLFHELGHNLRLYHGGAISTDLNCKPNLQTSMNYLYEMSGLLTQADGSAVIDYSRETLALNEGSLSEFAGLGFSFYRARWYASVFAPQVPAGTTEAGRHCDGITPKLDSEHMVRVDGPGLAIAGPYSLDWNKNGVINPLGTMFSQDVNFNGNGNPPSAADAAFSGFKQWDSIDLRQIGGRRDVLKLSLDIEKEDLAASDSGLSDSGLSDSGLSDSGLSDSGLSDSGLSDSGLSDDLDYKGAASIGSAPSGLTGQSTKLTINLTWNPTNVGKVTTYYVYRAPGSTNNLNNFTLLTTLNGINGTPPTAAFKDGGVTNNKTYTYYVKADATPVEGNTLHTGPSNFFTITKLP